MSKDDAGKNRVPDRANRIVVAPIPSFSFEDLHQLLIGQVPENQLKPFEITDFFKFVPAKDLGLWYSSDRASPFVILCLP